MPKPNYGHVKRQKEAARKARQEARLARKRSRATDPAAGEGGNGGAPPAGGSSPGAQS